MMRYEFYDRKRDCSQNCIEKLVKHNIFLLSNEWLIKYLKQANFLHKHYIYSYNSKNKKKKMRKKKKNND